ncbi:MAG: metallophosphoesterase [Deltaproteobacteria bacterium]|nr:metallophosphoesterase [Deltaproteobacteria bacterium]
MVKPSRPRGWRAWAVALLAVSCGGELAHETDDGGPGADADTAGDGAADADNDAPADELGAYDADAGEDAAPEFECPAMTGGALSFDGVEDRVEVAGTAGLGLPQFTLEAWVRWSGEGTAAGSGSGGVSAIPILAKGRGESDGSDVDCNYLLGIREGDHVLTADFEDLADGSNHPVAGATPLEPGVWRHAAATYDGTTWRLYLDGTLDAERTVAATPRLDSVQHVGLGTAFDSSGTAEGAFAGELDEVRIWDRARTEDELAAGMAGPPGDAEGLVARWALDETAGAAAADSHGGHDGAVSGAVWTDETAPFQLLDPPAIALVGPADGAIVPAGNVPLSVWVEARGEQPLTVEFLGRPVDPDFSIVALPDTQYYSATHPATFLDQTTWVRANAERYNIRAVLHEGDITDNGTSATQWANAEAAMSVLEDPLPGRPDGMPYGLAVGNHDQIGGTTDLYNATFGVDRFAARSYYGGHYGADNDNHWIEFTAGDSSYLALFLEYDTGADPDVLAWAHDVIAGHPGHHALVTLHSLIGIGDPGAWSAQGRATYEALRDLPQLDLMLCGHIHGEGRRSDTFDGHTIHTLLADYPGRDGGGDGWLRLMQFSPARGEVHVRTYSTLREEWETDADSDFVVPYEAPAADFETVARREGVLSGTVATEEWTGREAGRRYQWAVAAQNCRYRRVSTAWVFEAR